MNLLSRLAYSLDVSETTLLRAIPGSLAAVVVGWLACVVMLGGNG